MDLYLIVFRSYQIRGAETWFTKGEMVKQGRFVCWFSYEEMIRGFEQRVPTRED